MFGKILCGLAIVGAIAGQAASAATVDIDVTDSHGMPAANAVVSLTPNAAASPIAAHEPERSIIDQRHETFLPLVVVVRKGGEVVFTNNDVTMHQVYSFSPIKQFQFEIDQGQVSKPVVFDKTGVAAIGCNIHDGMVAFVFVADAPYAVVTDANGHAKIRDVPDGAYRASVWHPQMRIGQQPAPTDITVTASGTKLSLSAPLSDGGMPGMSHMHKTDY
jgi:plastocyanin